MKYAIVDIVWCKSHGIEVLPEMRTSVDQSKVILHEEFLSPFLEEEFPGFFSADKSVSVLLNKGFNLIASKRTSDKMVIKNIITGKSSEISANILIDNPGLYYLWRSATITNYAKAAIAGQTICNGYFSTDEEDGKVKDWYLAEIEKSAGKYKK
ncbi:hypothetical protein AAA162_12430 [Parabacteroides johnsonii]|uniref:hypothetical protein n=1 Tax=Parabacteroides johnsonii TaxID=387661 RepID=UPI0032C1A312